MFNVARSRRCESVVVGAHDSIIAQKPGAFRNAESRKWFCDPWLLMAHGAPESSKNPVGSLLDELKHKHMTDENVWREIASLKREVAALRREVEAARPHKVVAMGKRDSK